MPVSRLALAAAAMVTLQGCLYYGACVERVNISNAEGCWEYEDWVWEDSPTPTPDPKTGVPVFPDDCHGEAHDFTDCATLGFTERCGGLSTVYARPGEKPYVCVP